MTKETKKNNGEIPQYYVGNDHEAIMESLKMYGLFSKMKSQPQSHFDSKKDGS